MNWTSIIGKEYAERCHVSSLKKINQKNVLTVYCSDASLFELSYSTLEIKEKINGFFLRNVVSILLKDELGSLFQYFLITLFILSISFKISKISKCNLINGGNGP